MSYERFSLFFFLLTPPHLGDYVVDLSERLITYD